MRILKFGGSSLATAERIEQVAAVIERARGEERLAVVVSALGGVTDRLREMAETCRERRAEPAALIADLAGRHLETLEAVADRREHLQLGGKLRALLAELEEVLRGVALVGEVSPRSLDRISACGERLAAPIVAAALRRRGLDAEDADTRRLIVTDAVHGRARPDLDATRDRVRRHFAGATSLQVVPGFIGATAAGETTTLGRGGSDFTASILALALDASAVELWSDVDGVMSADPRLVPGVRALPHLRYDELMELSHFGAKVVHPPSVHPLRRRGIPLWIKNTFRPAEPGTLVADELPAEDGEGQPIRGISSIDRVTMARLEGDGMVGVPGVARRLFGALADRGVSVILISQASSEHSICFCVAPDDQPAMVEAVTAEFEVDRRAGDIDELAIEEDVSIVAVIGAAMRERPGIAGRLFSVLGGHGINVRAIAQGSSELNISLVVRRSDEAPAVRAIHRAFFESAPPATRLYLAGVGGVGGALLRQLAARPRQEPLLVLAGVADSKGAVIDAEGLDPSAARERLAGERPNAGLEPMIAAMTDGGGSRRVFVDCTAAEDMGGVYERLLDAGLAVVSANKKPLAGELAAYHRLTEARRGRLYAETTVGAGLPVVATLADLLATGDDLVRLEGVLSGTASYLAAELNCGEKLSRAVARAAELGFLEPDPREDLAGNDVARKLLILARLAGAAIEWRDLELAPLIPADPWLALEPEELRRRLPELDPELAERTASAAAAGRRLAYLASWDGSRAVAGWTEIEPSHPCWDLAAGENLVLFRTRRYASTPLVVRGPGAGPEVTAAGVLSDILRAVDESRGCR